MVVRHAGVVILGLGGVYDVIDTTFCKLVIRISLVAEINDRLLYCGIILGKIIRARYVLFVDYRKGCLEAALPIAI